MIFGHAALALLARKTVFRAVAFPLLLAAAYGPDAIDKTGMLLLRTPSKDIGHTLLVFGLLVAALLLAFFSRPSRKRRLLLFSVTLLWLSHLLLDLTDTSILGWPFLGPFPATDPYDLSEGLLSFYSGNGNRTVLGLDLTCMAAAGLVSLVSRWRKKPTAA